MHTAHTHTTDHAHTSAPRRRAAAAPERGGTRTLTPAADVDASEVGSSDVGRSDADFGPPAPPAAGEKSA
eukprot:scaffold43356_cov54-Phaeocystis_antarctica.AAC.3